MASRFSAVIVGLVVAYGFLLFHLYQLQFVQGGYYLARADSETAASANLNANRGAIYFTDDTGKTLPAAVNQQFPIIYADPSEIQNPADAAATLAPILNMPQSTLKQIFASNSQYHLLVNKASGDMVDAVNTAGTNGAPIKGIYTDYEPERYYPLGSVGSQVLGYVGPNASNTGQRGYYGVESFYNDQLNGAASSTDGVGQDITLTIDPNVQAEAEKILNDLVAANGATGGSVIIENPQTGAIIAMGATPSFDPNNYGQASISNFLNPNVQSVYEPGSIFKVLTMAAGIDSGKVTPNETYDDKGYINVDGAHITNYNLTTYGAYGPGTTMTQVIEHSINTGAIFAENQTGNGVFTEYMKRFGLGQKTGIDLPGEVAGNLSQLNPKSPQVDFDTAAYGQGVAVTPIELVQSIAAIANGGVLMRPYLDAALKPEVVGRAISSSTATKVTTMMTAAIDNVPGAPAISGYSLAGKTGSAFVPNPKGGGYLNELDDSYIGFGPTNNPQFVAFIRLNTLPVTSLAVDSVVPGFRQLAQYLINYYNIPPDRNVSGN